MNDETSQDACTCSATLHCMITHHRANGEVHKILTNLSLFFSASLNTPYSTPVTAYTTLPDSGYAKNNCAACTVHICNKTVDSTVMAKSSTKTYDSTKYSFSFFAMRALHKEHVLDISQFFLNLVNLKGSKPLIQHEEENNTL